MGTGQAFVNKVGPVVCALILIMFITVTVILFTARGVAVPGYTPGNTSEYYADHLDELAAELRDNMLPLLDAGGVTVSVENGKIVFTGGEKEAAAAKLGALHYYDAGLFA